MENSSMENSSVLDLQASPGESSAMVRGSFILLDRVSARTEQRLWAAAIRNWEEYRATTIPGISPLRKARHHRQLLLAERALKNREWGVLADLFPSREHWRLFPLLREEALYLDIETSGRYGDVTVLGAWDGEQYYSFVRGCNLEKELVKELFSRFRVVVTFNGASFDLPVLRRYFGDDIFPEEILHIDLRHVLARLGFTGGLKAIEARLGLEREEDVKGFSGEDASLVWYQYCITGEDDLMELLLAYNKADCVNLEPLARFAVSRLWQELRKV